MKLPKTTDAKLQALADKLAAAVMEGRSRDVVDFYESPVVKALNNNHRVFLQSRIPYEKMIPYCEAGVLPWWSVFSARVACGDIAGMKVVHALFRNSSSEKVDYYSASSWGSHPYEIVPGVPVTPKAEILAQLIEWGGEKVFQNENYYKMSLKKSEADIIAVYLKAGAAVDTAVLVMKDLLDQNPQQAEKIWTAIGGMAPTYLADNHILSEEEYRLEPSGLGKLRIEFDFRARRVREIYVAPKKEYSCMASISFDEYDRDDIEAAREKLVQMGGKPGEKDVFNGKKRLGLKGLGGGAGGHGR